MARRLLGRLLRESGPAGWRDGGPLAAAVFPAARVAIEVTGWARPVDQRRVRPDRLRLAGWTVLRFGLPELLSRPQGVLAEIRAAVAGE
jgi:very-short-patch-repair endonuclease